MLIKSREHMTYRGSRGASNPDMLKNKKCSDTAAALWHIWEIYLHSGDVDIMMSGLQVSSCLGASGRQHRRELNGFGIPQEDW